MIKNFKTFEVNVDKKMSIKMKLIIGPCSYTVKGLIVSHSHGKSWKLVMCVGCMWLYGTDNGRGICTQLACCNPYHNGTYLVME